MDGEKGHTLLTEQVQFIHIEEIRDAENCHENVTVRTAGGKNALMNAVIIVENLRNKRTV